MSGAHNPAHVTPDARADPPTTDVPPLALAHAEHRQLIHGGLGLLLYGVLATTALAIANLYSSLTGMIRLDGALNLAQFAAQVIVGLGCWCYTVPDPDVETPRKAHAARLAVRAAIGLGSAAVLTRGTLLLAMPSDPPTTGPGAIAVSNANTLFDALAAVFFVAWLVQFAAISRYSAWIASRIPDAPLRASALRCRWLLPLISLVVPLLIGPIVALVRYWKLLHAVRERVRAVA